MENSFKNTVRALLPILIAQVLIGATHGQLLAEDASEGPCLSMSELLPHLHSGLNLVPVIFAYQIEINR